MRTTFLFCLLGLANALQAAPSNVEPAVVLDPALRPFFEEHCHRCHGEKKQKADFRLDTLSGDLSNVETIGHWQDVLEMLDTGEMPPKKEKRPPADALSRVTARLTAQLEVARGSAALERPHAILRRLNRTEYLNSLRDLLGINISLFDPTLDFPADAAVHGFDNNGAALVTSGFLLRRYLHAADAAVEKAFQTIERPEVRRYAMKPPFDRTALNWNKNERRANFGYQQIWQGPASNAGPGGYMALDDIMEGVPSDGYYRVRVRASGMHRNHPYDREMIGTNPDEPIRLALVAGSLVFGDLQHSQPRNVTLAEFDLPDNEPEWVEARVWLDKGFQPRLTYPNGPFAFKPLAGRLPAMYPEQLDPTKRYAGEMWDYAIHHVLTPRVRVFAVEVEGPLFDRWPPPPLQALLGGEAFAPERVPASIERFASRAFRRPATSAQVASYVKLYESRRADGDSPLVAFKAAVKAILCSSSFLYMDAPEGPLDDYALASRLSYFLWQSGPDDTLMQLAARGELRRPGELARQTTRLLADEKSAAFVNGFTTRWLGLYKLGAMPPETKTFRNYYIGNLEEAMRTETRLFFADVLHNNRDIGLFLESDYTFVNDRLAQHYGFPVVKGSGFQRVAISDPRRGGLLGQASVLTVTANGVDTSPVVRGVWVLENILGTPPKPPPAGVPAIEPDTRGATTFREQLAKHRADPNCASCHQKIDPPGFALESFDAIGSWRTAYNETGTLRVDPSGETADGRTFQDVVGFKHLLAGRKPQFARCLTEKLLTFAVGRELYALDRPHVDRIVKELDAHDNRLADLVHLVVASEPFANN